MTPPPSPRARRPTPPCSPTASASWTSSDSGRRGVPQELEPGWAAAGPSRWGGLGSGGRCTTWGGAGATRAWCRFSRASGCVSPPPSSSRLTSRPRASLC
uniref:Uncharacterized protein n=1 Tax=Arundo donax TaxID=35708 RepID=A0A0A9HHH4_ARUDO